MRAVQEEDRVRNKDEGRTRGYVMDTPILDFLRQYSEHDWVRFHMPGHKSIWKRTMPDS